MKTNKQNPSLSWLKVYVESRKLRTTVGVAEVIKMLHGDTGSFISVIGSSYWSRGSDVLPFFFTTVGGNLLCSKKTLVCGIVPNFIQKVGSAVETTMRSWSLCWRFSEFWKIIMECLVGALQVPYEQNSRTEKLGCLNT